MADLGSQQANDDEAARKSELHARDKAALLSEPFGHPVPEMTRRLFAFTNTGASSAGPFVEGPQVRETTPTLSKSTIAPARAYGHLRPTARRGDTIELDAKVDAPNQSAQPSTDADDPRTQAARAITFTSMDIPIALDKKTLPDDGVVDLRSQQANDEAARKSELHARDEAALLSGPFGHPVPETARRLFTFTNTGASSAGPFVEGPQVRETTPTLSKSTIAPARAYGHIRTTARRGDTIELDVKADAPNQPAQPSTDADDQAARAIPVSKSYSRLTPNVPGTTQRESSGFTSLSTTSLLDEENRVTPQPHVLVAPTIPVSLPSPFKTSPSLPDQPSNTALAGPSAGSPPPIPLDSLAKSRDILASSVDRTTRKKDSSSSMQVRTSEPTFSAADTIEGHGVNLRDPQPSLSRSFAARQGQGDPVASGEPVSSIRESSQTPSPPVRIEHRSRTGGSHLEPMRSEAAGGDGSEGQAGGGGQQGGNNMPREIRPVIAGRDTTIDTEPPRTAPMQLASPRPQEGGGSRDVAESSRRGLPRSATTEIGMQSSGSTYDLGDTRAATQISSGRPEDGGPPGPLREPPERPEEPAGTFYSWFRSLFVTEQPFEGSGRGEGSESEDIQKMNLSTAQYADKNKKSNSNNNGCCPCC
ncbi:hypothetical protein BGW80DRAFT_127076 [Lactifluus volemus]|nr:hypothetical protein BGW80DRAFT_127076 [Lactifluus volemus]